MATTYPCIVCNLEVRPRQHALQCDDCDRWQHRVKCTPGMNVQQYRLLSQQPDVQWKCAECLHTTTPTAIPSSMADDSIPDNLSEISAPVFESTRNTSPPERDDEQHLSFEIPHVSFETPEELMEETIADPIPSPLNYQPREITYHVIQDGSQMGKRKLVESTGFAYVVKVKEMARRDVFRPASTIVEQVLSDNVDERQPCPSLPAPVNLARQANRARQRMRPTEPKDLDFEISDEHIPDDFLQCDVRVGNYRHLVFYTNQQLRLMETTKTWYMDATFSIVKQPFTQMFSVHAFVRSGRDTKQVPLAFVLMSRKRRIDYKKVFKCICRKMSPGMAPKAGVADFEAGIWQGFRQVFPTAKLNGCSFHWSQAVFRKVQKLGLEEAYNKQDAKYKFIRRVMALPYLPAEHIHPAFTQLLAHATTPELQALMAYINDTWMSSSVWPVRSWSVFGRSVRTNNDVEGWHRRINLKANRPNVQFYLLLPLLHEEARLVTMQMRLVSEGKLRKNQRLRVRKTQGKLFQLWGEYEQGQLSASQLLREVSHLKL